VSKEHRPSLPGSTRQSILFAKLLAKKMDPRVKPGGDEKWMKCALARDVKHPPATALAEQCAARRIIPYALAG